MHLLHFAYYSLLTSLSILSLTLILAFTSITANGQNSAPAPLLLDKTSFGVGAGLDMGGIGVNLAYYPQPEIGFFGGLGYSIAGVGTNAGIKLRFVPASSRGQVVPYVLAMYGYNAVIIIKGAPQRNKLFYGPTVGLGMDLQAIPRKTAFVSLGVFYPFRSEEVESFRVSGRNAYLPITFSIAVRFTLAWS